MNSNDASILPEHCQGTVNFGLLEFLKTITFKKTPECPVCCQEFEDKADARDHFTLVHWNINSMIYIDKYYVLFCKGACIKKNKTSDSSFGHYHCPLCKHKSYLRTRIGLSQHCWNEHNISPCKIKTEGVKFCTKLSAENIKKSVIDELCNHGKNLENNCETTNGISVKRKFESQHAHSSVSAKRNKPSLNIQEVVELDESENDNSTRPNRGMLLDKQDSLGSKKQISNLSVAEKKLLLRYYQRQNQSVPKELMLLKNETISKDDLQSFNKDITKKSSNFDNNSVTNHQRGVKEIYVNGRKATLGFITHKHYELTNKKIVDNFVERTGNFDSKILMTQTVSLDVFDIEDYLEKFEAGLHREESVPEITYISDSDDDVKVIDNYSETNKLSYLSNKELMKKGPSPKPLQTGIKQPTNNLPNSVKVNRMHGIKQPTNNLPNSVKVNRMHGSYQDKLKLSESNNSNFNVMQPDTDISFGVKVPNLMIHNNISSLYLLCTTPCKDVPHKVFEFHAKSKVLAVCCSSPVKNAQVMCIRFDFTKYGYKGVSSDVRRIVHQVAWHLLMVAEKNFKGFVGRVQFSWYRDTTENILKLLRSCEVQMTRLQKDDLDIPFAQRNKLNLMAVARARMSLNQPTVYRMHQSDAPARDIVQLKANPSITVVEKDYVHKRHLQPRNIPIRPRPNVPLVTVHAPNLCKPFPSSGTNYRTRYLRPPQQQPQQAYNQFPTRPQMVNQVQNMPGIYLSNDVMRPNTPLLLMNNSNLITSMPQKGFVPPVPRFTAPFMTFNNNTATTTAAAAYRKMNKPNILSGKENGSLIRKTVPNQGVMGVKLLNRTEEDKKKLIQSAVDEESGEMCPTFLLELCMKEGLTRDSKGRVTQFSQMETHFEFFNDNDVDGFENSSKDDGSSRNEDSFKTEKNAELVDNLPNTERNSKDTSLDSDNTVGNANKEKVPLSFEETKERVDKSSSGNEATLLNVEGKTVMNALKEDENEKTNENIGAYKSEQEINNEKCKESATVTKCNQMEVETICVGKDNTLPKIEMNDTEKCQSDGKQTCDGTDTGKENTDQIDGTIIDNTCQTEQNGAEISEKIFIENSCDEVEIGSVTTVTNIETEPSYSQKNSEEDQSKKNNEHIMETSPKINFRLVMRKKIPIADEKTLYMQLKKCPVVAVRRLCSTKNVRYQLKVKHGLSNESIYRALSTVRNDDNIQISKKRADVRKDGFKLLQRVMKRQNEFTKFYILGCSPPEENYSKADASDWDKVLKFVEDSAVYRDLLLEQLMQNHPHINNRYLKAVVAALMNAPDCETGKEIFDNHVSKMQVSERQNLNLIKHYHYNPGLLKGIEGRLDMDAFLEPTYNPFACAEPLNLLDYSEILSIVCNPDKFFKHSIFGEYQDPVQFYLLKLPRSFLESKIEITKKNTVVNLPGINQVDLPYSSHSERLVLSIIIMLRRLASLTKDNEGVGLEAKYASQILRLMRNEKDMIKSRREAVSIQNEIISTRNSLTRIIVKIVKYKHMLKTVIKMSNLHVDVMKIFKAVTEYFDLGIQTKPSKLFNIDIRSLDKDASDSGTDLDLVRLIDFKFANQKSLYSDLMKKMNKNAGILKSSNDESLMVRSKLLPDIRLRIVKLGAEKMRQYSDVLSASVFSNTYMGITALKKVAVTKASVITFYKSLVSEKYEYKTLLDGLDIVKESAVNVDDLEIVQCENKGLIELYIPEEYDSVIVPHSVLANAGVENYGKSQLNVKVKRSTDVDAEALLCNGVTIIPVNTRQHLGLKLQQDINGWKNSNGLIQFMYDKNLKMVLTEGFPSEKTFFAVMNAIVPLKTGSDGKNTDNKGDLRKKTEQTDNSNGSKNDSKLNSSEKSSKCAENELNQDIEKERNNIKFDIENNTKVGNEEKSHSKENEVDVEQSVSGTQEPNNTSDCSITKKSSDELVENPDEMAELFVRYLIENSRDSGTCKESAPDKDLHSSDKFSNYEEEKSTNTNSENPVKINQKRNEHADEKNAMTEEKNSPKTTLDSGNIFEPTVRKNSDLNSEGKDKATAISSTESNGKSSDTSSAEDSSKDEIEGRTTEPSASEEPFRRQTLRIKEFAKIGAEDVQEKKDVVDLISDDEETDEATRTTRKFKFFGNTKNKSMVKNDGEGSNKKMNDGTIIEQLENSQQCKSDRSFSVTEQVLIPLTDYQFKHTIQSFGEIQKARTNFFLLDSLKLNSADLRVYLPEEKEYSLILHNPGLQKKRRNEDIYDNCIDLEPVLNAVTENGRNPEPKKRRTNNIEEKSIEIDDAFVNEADVNKPDLVTANNQSDESGSETAEQNSGIKNSSIDKQDKTDETEESYSIDKKLIAAKIMENTKTKAPDSPLVDAVVATQQPTHNVENDGIMDVSVMCKDPLSTGKNSKNIAQNTSDNVQSDDDIIMV